MGNRRTLALGSLVLLTFAPACAPRDPPVAEATSAIQGGSVDPRDTAVVGVAMIDDDGYVTRTCSGTLVAPNLVLTAQHCVADTKPFVDCRTSVFGAATEPYRLRVTLSASMWSREADWLPVTEVIRPPGAASVCGNDVALLMLGTCIDGQNALPIAPRLDGLPERAEEYAAIGYGTTSGSTDDAGTRRRRDALRVVCVGEACSSHQIEAVEWRGDHGICNGDSGGPAIDGDGFVIGVTSRGPMGCDNPIYGSLLGHADWIREAGHRAALDGAYTDPDWVRGPQVTSPAQPTTLDLGVTGCGVDGHGPREGGGWLMAVLAWAAARRLR